MGSAYTAQASDVYAPTWNPGGLGLVQGTQLAGQHLAYLESINYEYLSFVHQVAPGKAWGSAVQYLGSGNIQGTDISGNSTGDFSAHYGAYSLAYGQMFGDKLSLGAAGKWINAKIADVGANAFAMDFGAMYQWNKDLTLGAAVTNAGSKLKFIDQGDSLPLQTHFGATYHTRFHTDVSAEVVYRQTGLASFHTGLEWHPTEPISLRAGYRTDTVKGLSPLAGFTTGIGIHAWGHEFAYAWLPLGDLGSTQYFSVVLKFGGKDKKRNLINYQSVKRPKPAKHADDPEELSPEDDLMTLLHIDEGTPMAESPREMRTK
jgi:hypothetical protein